MEVQFISNELFNNSKVPDEAKCELIEEMKKHFTTEDQLFFVNSFYTYLNYHPTEDFGIDLSDVYEWLGFSRLDPAKRILVKKFSEGNDYQIQLHNSVELVKVNGGSGLNKEKIMMNIETFKGLCMIAGTQKAGEIRKYFLKLESITMSVIKNSIENNRQIKDKQTKLIAQSEYIVTEFSNKPVAYIAMVEEQIDCQIVKYGHTVDIKRRTKDHKTTYGDQFNMVYAIESKEHYEVERQIKNHNDLVTRKVKNYKNKDYNELLRLDKNFSIENLIELMKSISSGICGNVNIQLELEREKTKQEQEKTKQMEIQLRLAEIQANKEIRLAELNQKSSVNQQTPIQQETIVRVEENTNKSRYIPSEQECESVKKFIDTFTYTTDNYKDYIFLDDLYTKYVGLDIIYVSRQRFGIIMNKFFHIKRVRTTVKPSPSNMKPRSMALVNRKMK